MTTQTTMEPLFPLWTISAFEKIEEFSSEELREHDMEYRKICKQIIQMEDEYSFVRNLVDGKSAVRINEEEHEIYNQYQSLCFDRERKERQYYYWMGHKQSLEYLKKAGLVTEQEG